MPTPPYTKRVTFLKTKEEYGLFSNMAGGYPIHVPTEYGEVINFVPSSEALYQALRFPSFYLVQEEVLEAPNGFVAKLVAKKYLDRTRRDWNDVRVQTMRLAVLLKSLSHPSFQEKLQQTGPETEIVEISRKDPFWGMVPQQKDDFSDLRGENTLGKILMDLRDMGNDGFYQKFFATVDNQGGPYTLLGRDLVVDPSFYKNPRNRPSSGLELVSPPR